MKSGKNLLKISLLQIKLLTTNNNISTCTLKIKLKNGNSIFTERILELDKPMCIELSSESAIVELSAVSKTSIYLNSELGKLQIPVNLNNIKEVPEKFNLKNNKEENILMTEILFSHLNNKEVIKYFNSNSKSEIPESNTKNLINNSIIDENKTKKLDYINVIPHSKLNKTANFDKVKAKSQSSNLDVTVVYDESCKSPDISNICNDVFSPFSQRNSANFIISHNEKFNDSRVNHTTINNDKNFLNNTSVQINSKHMNHTIIDGIDGRRINLNSEEKEYLEKINEKYKVVEKKEKQLKAHFEILLKEKEQLNSKKEKYKNIEYNFKEENKKIEQGYLELELINEKLSNDINLYNEKLRSINFESEKLSIQRDVASFDKQQMSFFQHLTECLNINETDDEYICYLNNKYENDSILKSPEINKKSKLQSEYEKFNFTKDSLSPNVNVIDSLDFSRSGNKNENFINENLSSKQNLRKANIYHLYNKENSPDHNLSNIKEMDENDNEASVKERKNLNIIFVQLGKKNTLKNTPKLRLSDKNLRITSLKNMNNNQTELRKENKHFINASSSPRQSKNFDNKNVNKNYLNEVRRISEDKKGNEKKDDKNILAKSNGDVMSLNGKNANQISVKKSLEEKKLTPHTKRVSNSNQISGGNFTSKSNAPKSTKRLKN